ncbi:MAG: exosome complex RNA-binding protein Rrp4 [Nanoarchaeota archaeon]|nr:exosome complex protein Rrp4 [Nanoarchaeota archaeon]MBU4451444.1 exosome complex protein Rrp4 [Nanoarchaeota archaeon]MCG2723788.1 exosome complex RNA-binding protein Rrp4 [archaeon]
MMQTQTQLDTQPEATTEGAQKDVKEQKIVLPGDFLVESKEILPGYGTYRVGDKIYAKLVGIQMHGPRVVYVVPLAGSYVPKPGDYVVGEIKEAAFSFWNIDINSPYSAAMSSMDTNDFIPKAADLSRYFNVGDLIFCLVSGVTQSKYTNVSMRDPKARKLVGGVVIEMTSSKIPRLIGKEGSMINLIKDKTKCFLTAGQNGRVWIKGEHEDIAVEAVQMIEKFAHTQGLTDRMNTFLIDALAKKGVHVLAQALVKAPENKIAENAEGEVIE